QAEDGIRDRNVTGVQTRALPISARRTEKVVDDNRPVRRAVLTQNTAALETSLLQTVVAGGTGKLARLSDGRPQAGKTGTTENYRSEERRVGEDGRTGEGAERCSE